MNGILGEVGKALVTLQNEGQVIVEKTEEIFLDEIIFSLVKVLISVKASYKIEVLEEGVKSKITLQ